MWGKRVDDRGSFAPPPSLKEILLQTKAKVALESLVTRLSKSSKGSGLGCNSVNLSRNSMLSWFPILAAGQAVGESICLYKRQNATESPLRRYGSLC
jgi:hypothetical protein